MQVLIDQWNSSRVAAKWDENEKKWIPESGYENEKFIYQQKSPDHLDFRGLPIPRWKEINVGSSEGPGTPSNPKFTPSEPVE